MKFDVACLCLRFGAPRWEASLDQLNRFKSVLVPIPRACAVAKAGGIEELFVPWPADVKLQNSGS